eukprot:CAMPEP_0204255302 /NCGR_PEP_ID=MMETSP0468-20130131/3138_1 /ASSEMBLY_ACC=CAM_ASM_000383 /TAXON_ID=2969 /ORGANISM="Oxyrrhis marina" /LENGTH=66 /DNA_ID=CAMNT_0051229169 /DNA_START=351 /DNA_END=548 /DNA_ORIENTATION=-
MIPEVTQTKAQHSDTVDFTSGSQPQSTIPSTSFTSSDTTTEHCTAEIKEASQHTANGPAFSIFSCW